MRVVFLTHYYPPEVGAPQARIQALALALARTGVAVTVHTGFPHYPDGIVRPPHRLRRLVVEEDGPVRVVRTWVHPAPNRGTVRRLAGHASFAAGAVAHARTAGPADVVVAESPPLFTAVGAVAYARRLSAPLVLNCSDLWPQSAIELGALRGAAPIAAAEWLERWCYRHARVVTVPVEGMARAAAARGARAETIGPAVDAARFAGVPALEPGGPAGPLRVLYAGTLGLAQGLGSVLEAARIAGPDAVALTLVGDGADAPALRAGAASLANVAVHPAVPAEAVAGLYAAHDVAVVALRDRAVFVDALPTKLFEAFAAGRPAVVAAPDGAATALVRDTGTGVAVAPEDPAALAGAFAALATDRVGVGAMGARARTLARERFDRPVAVAAWSAVLERVRAR